MKEYYASGFFLANTFASGYYRGVGVDIADIRGWVTMRSHLPQDVTLTDMVVTKLSLKSQAVTSIGGVDG